MNVKLNLLRAYACSFKAKVWRWSVSTYHSFLREIWPVMTSRSGGYRLPRKHCSTRNIRTWLRIQVNRHHTQRLLPTYLFQQTDSGLTYLYICNIYFRVLQIFNHCWCFIELKFCASVSFGWHCKNISDFIQNSI